MNTFCLRLGALWVYFADRGLDTVEVVETFCGKLDPDTSACSYPRAEARKQWKQLLALGAVRTA